MREGGRAQQDKSTVAEMTSDRTLDLTSEGVSYFFSYTIIVRTRTLPQQQPGNLGVADAVIMVCFCYVSPRWRHALNSQTLEFSIQLGGTCKRAGGG